MADFDSPCKLEMAKSRGSPGLSIVRATPGPGRPEIAKPTLCSAHCGLGRTLTEPMEHVNMAAQ